MRHMSSLDIVIIMKTYELILRNNEFLKKLLFIIL